MESLRTRSTVLPVLALCAILVGTGLAAWSLIRPDGDNGVRWIAAGSLLLAAAGLFVFFILRTRRDSRPVEETGRGRPGIPTEPLDVSAISREMERARAAIGSLSGEPARQALGRSLDELGGERERREFRVVVFGTGSAGKTSLINALIGREVGATDPIMGTTRQGEIHTEVVEGVEGTLLLTDTPGLSEFGEAGVSREREARRLAEAADLILFVVDHDLIRAELDALLDLSGLRKRLIVVFNKIDRFNDEDRAAILAKLRERLKGHISSDDVVAVAAAPRPIPVRVVGSDGTSEIHYEPAEPDVTELEARVARILEREGPALRAGNLLLRTRRLERMAVEELARERRTRALAVIEKYQWIAAASVFASPTAVINLATGGTAQYQMVGELAQVYGAEASPSRNRTVVAQLIAGVLKLGLTEAATTLIAGLFKTTFLGYAAAGAVQAVAMAYLTRVSGLAVAEYFERGQTWGRGGLDETLLRQFDATSRTDFLQDFIRQAIQKLVDRAGLRPVSTTETS
jgi:small GTP-binding protein